MSAKHTREGGFIFDGALTGVREIAERDGGKVGSLAPHVPNGKE